MHSRIGHRILYCQTKLQRKYNLIQNYEYRLPSTVLYEYSNNYSKNGLE